jgi:hypothetical protein
MPQNKNLTLIYSSGGGTGGIHEVNFATKTGIDRKAGSPLPAVKQKNQNQNPR